MSTQPANVALEPDAAQDSGPVDAQEEVPIIDCDVHHMYADVSALFPYLPRQYVEYIQDFGPMMPGIGYTNMPGNGFSPRSLGRCGGESGHHAGCRG